MMFGSRGFIHEGSTQPAFKETRDTTTVCFNNRQRGKRDTTAVHISILRANI